MKLDKRVWIIFVIQVTEVLGFSLILPFLPYYAQEYGASPLTVGMMLTVFSLFQFISSPIMGRLSDSYGRRPLLILSQISTMLSFIVLGFANSLFLIFFSRIIDGMLGSNFTIAQAYLSDISTKKDRSKIFGISGAAFGVGFMIGPAIGGYLSQFSYSLPAFVAAGIAGLSIVLTYFFLPETVKKTKLKLSEVKIIDINQFKRYFSNSKIFQKMQQFFLYILAHVTWTSSIAIYLRITMDLRVDYIGYLYAYIGLISIILRLKIIPWLVDRYEEVLLMKVAAVMIILSLLGIVMPLSIPLLLLLMTFFASGSGIIRPLMTGAISRAVSKKEQGAVLGVTNSLGSIAQIFGPMIGGALLISSAPKSLLVVSAMFMFWGFILMFNGVKKKS